MRIRKLLRDLSKSIPNRFWFQRHSSVDEASGQLTNEPLAGGQEESPTFGGDEPNEPTPAIRNSKDVVSSSDDGSSDGSEIPVEAILKANAEWRRENFEPHAVVICPSKVPSSIVIYGLIGGESQRIIHFPEHDARGSGRLTPENYSNYVKVNLPERIPLMGKTIGYAVNYSLDHSIEYDVHGNVVCERDSYYDVGDIYLGVGP